MRALRDRLAGGVAACAGACFVIIIAISALEVVMRYVFDAPTIWVHELSVALAAVAFLLGGPLVHRRRGHIAITFFHDRMPAPRRWRATILNDILTLVCLGFLCWAAVAQALQSIDSMETSGTATNWPTPVVLKSLLALCALWLLAQSVWHLVTDLRRPAREP